MSLVSSLLRSAAQAVRSCAASPRSAASGDAPPPRAPCDALTPYQQAAFEEAHYLVRQGHARTAAAGPLPCYTLSGYAGTGKSYLLAALIHTFSEEEVPLFVTATTHKAAGVIRRSLARRGLHFPADRSRTAQSLLGLQLVPDGAGSMTLAPAPARELPEGAVVVCDEGSMAGRLVFYEALATTARGCTWLFCGDPPQLPPVGEPRSKVFSLAGPTLRHVVRQSKDNPAQVFATALRNGQRPRLKTIMHGGRGTAVTASEDALLRSAAGVIEAALCGQHADHCRILAFTNERVRYWNRRVREQLFGQGAPALLPGEFVTALESWYPPEANAYAGGAGPQADGPITNSQVFRVVGTEEARYRAAGVSGRDPWWSVLQTTLEDALSGDHLVVPVLAGHERPLLKQALTERRRAAARGSASWTSFYELRDAFPRIEYAYASTIHRSQGSTYHTAYVDWPDTARCRDAGMRRALRYVAASRPSHRLALLV